MKKYQKSFTLLFILIFCIQTIGYADFRDIKIRSGYWKTNDENTGVSHACVDSNTIQSFIEAGQRFMGSACNTSLKKNSESEYHHVSNCNYMGSRVFIESKAYGDFYSRITTVSKTIVEPALAGFTNSNTRAVSEYIGACPRDMQPGDVRLQDGQKMNVSQMFDKIPNPGAILEGIQSGQGIDVDQVQKMMELLQQRMQAG